MDSLTFDHWRRQGQGHNYRHSPGGNVVITPPLGLRVPRQPVIDRNDVLTRLLPAAPQRYRAIIATAAGTGMRWGEVTGLCRCP